MPVLNIRFFSSSESIRVWILSEDVSDMVAVGGAKGKVLESLVRRHNLTVRE